MEREAFERALAYHCAPALVGLRCACVISLSSADYPALPRVAGPVYASAGTAGRAYRGALPL